MINDNEIARCVRKAMDAYFRDLDGERPAAIYDMVICSVEKPLIEIVLARVDGNQTPPIALCAGSSSARRGWHGALVRGRSSSHRRSGTEPRRSGKASHQ